MKLTTIELTEQFCHLITWQYPSRDKQRGWYLSSETQIPLSWSIVADFNGQNHQQSVKSVREIAQAATVAAGVVVLIMPDQQVLNKSLSLPAALSARQCQQALGQAVSQSLSYSMEAVYWDVLRVEKAQAGQRHFELCVVRRKVIEACRAMCAALQWPLDMVIPKSALLASPLLPVEAGGYRLASQAAWQQGALPWRYRLGAANASAAARHRLHRAACEYCLAWQSRYQGRYQGCYQPGHQIAEPNDSQARDGQDEAALINLMPWQAAWQARLRRRYFTQVLSGAALVASVLLTLWLGSEPLYQQRQTELTEQRAQNARLQQQVQERQSEAKQWAAWSQAWTLWLQQQARHHQLWFAWQQTTDWLDGLRAQKQRVTLLHWHWQPQQWTWQVEMPSSYTQAPPFHFGGAIAQRDNTPLAAIQASGPEPVVTPLDYGWRHWRYQSLSEGHKERQITRLTSSSDTLVVSGRLSSQGAFSAERAAQEERAEQEVITQLREGK